MDRRRRKTREAIVASFTRLFFERGYHGFSMNAVAESADIGRSTLYTHFRRKEEVLGASLGPHLDILADSLNPAADDVLVRLMRHFWDGRKHRAIFSPGPCRNILLSLLAERIEQRLEASGWRIPRPLAAQLIADHQLSLIDQWLSRYGSLSPPEVAEILARNAGSLRDSLRNAARHSAS
jgi:AcrR family transcriptional regulator